MVSPHMNMGPLPGLSTSISPYYGFGIPQPGTGFSMNFNQFPPPLTYHVDDLSLLSLAWGLPETPTGNHMNFNPSGAVTMGGNLQQFSFYPEGREETSDSEGNLRGEEGDLKSEE